MDSCVVAEATATAALRCALVFAGLSAPPAPRVAALLDATAHGAANDLDAASSSFAETVRQLRDVAGFGASPAWHDPNVELHPWVSVLEKEVGIIQSELRESLLQQGSHDSTGSALLATDDAWDGAEYKAIAPAWGFRHLWQDGQWLPDAKGAFPRTVALLQRLEAEHGLRLNLLQNVACGFAKQPMGSGIAPHCDGNLIGLTAHLGLQVPSHDCWIEVGGHRRAWCEGKLQLMDTTHSHQTFNGGECDRVILMLNVLRPEIEEAEMTLLRHYMRAPLLHLARLNAGWLCVPVPEADSSGVGSSKDVIGGHRSTEAALVCVPSAVDDEGVRVQLAPGGPWRAQRAQGGSAGWVCWMHMHMPTARLQPLSTCPLHALSVEPPSTCPLHALSP